MCRTLSPVMYIFSELPFFLYPLISPEFMQYKGLLLLFIIAGFAIYSGIANAGSKSVSTEVLPQDPVQIVCTVADGHTTVSVTALDSIQNVSATIDQYSGSVADELRKGWSVSRTVSGVHSTVNVSFVWHGAEKTVPVVCK
jgi:hypothetical protein